jgi:RNA polymerase sigma factor (sigma-70 family)
MGERLSFPLPAAPRGAIERLEHRSGNVTLAYARMVPELRRIVARNVRAPAGVVEEACQIAWSRWLIRRAELAPGAALGWLSTTASREALRLLRLQARQVPLGTPRQSAGSVVELPVTSPGPEEIVEVRERLADVRRLPARQQRMLWLQGFGYSYREIGARTGDTRRTVERQLRRARHRLAEAE